MKAELSAHPVTQYALPPLLQPAEVTAARERFERVTAQLAAAKDERRALVEEGQQARNAAHAATTRALIDGDAPPKDSVEVVAARVDAQVAEIDARLGLLREAVDQAGNELAEAVGVHAAAWADELDANGAEFAEAYERRLAEALSALADAAAARTSAKWLRRFDAGLATIAKSPQYHGRVSAPVELPRYVSFAGRVDALDVIRTLAAAARPPVAAAVEPSGDAPGTPVVPPPRRRAAGVSGGRLRDLL